MKKRGLVGSQMYWIIIAIILIVIGLASMPGIQGKATELIKSIINSVKFG
jgi:hypothetical protein|tara:strand:- start:526 stop:675 length:150 start_codon:yes stop_codon:yes gene_type:complete